MPTWPAVVDTTGMDNDTDSLPRAAILDLTSKFNDVIALRGAAGGVCDLDGSGVIPVARIPAAIARLANPVLTGNPEAPSQALRNNSTRLATTAFVLANGLLNGTLAKTAAYTVVAADFGQLIDCTGSGGWTLAIDAAATLGVFAFAVRNSSSGTITLDPYGSEQVDGVATVSFAPGESGFVLGNGTAWKTVGRTSSSGYDSEVVAGLQTITTAGALTLAHGLGAAPKFIQTLLKCTTAEHGYSIGDYLFIDTTGTDNGATGGVPTGVSIVPDATNLNVRFANFTAVFRGLHKTTGAQASFTNTSWAFVVRTFR